MIDPQVSVETIEARQAAELRRRQRTSAANIIVASVSAAAVAPVLSIETCLIWVLATAVIVLCRWGTTLFATRRGVSNRAQLRAHAVGASASGLAWGALPVLLWESGGVAEFAFAGFVIAGVSAGGLSSLSWYRPAYFGYLLGATIPLATVCLLQGSALFVAMGILVLCYVAVLVSTSVSFGCQLREIVRLRCALEVERGELDGARRELKLADSHKWQTLAHLSHHLRTPMNAVLGFSELIAAESLGKLGHPKYLEYAEAVRSSGTEALRAITAILDVAELETGTLTLSLADQDLAALTAEAVAMHSDLAASRGVEVRSELPRSGASVTGDRQRLRQILDGLISNAVHFSQEDQIVSVEVAAEDGWWAVRVRDDGVGIPEGKMDEALIPFVRLNNPFIKEFSGIGVGLTLARRLTLLHGGEFELDSGPDCGTTVTVRLRTRAEQCPPTVRSPACFREGSRSERLALLAIRLDQ